MARRRDTTGLIPDLRARGDTLGKRKKGLRKKAWELSVLCGVDVALVVAAADGAGAAADVWESREGVLARYRALAPEARARHAHRAYLEGELGKAEAKLARVRQGGPGGLRGWEDTALDGVATAGEARGLLEAIDAAIRAADARRRALKLQANDDGGDGGAAGVVVEGIEPQLLSSAAGIVVDGDCYAPYRGPGGLGDDNGQVMWGIDGGFQPCGAADMQIQPGGYGFRHCATSCGAGTDGCYRLQMAPAMYGNNNGDLADAFPYQLPRNAQPNLAPTWSAVEVEPRHAMVPVEYYDTGLSYNYMVDTQAADASLQGDGGWSFATGASGNFFTSTTPPALSLTIGGGNFVDAPPAPAALTHNMDRAGDNFTIDDATLAQPLAMSYSGDLTLTDAGWYAEQWQCQEAPEPQLDGGGGQQPIQQLHYLSDLEDTQLHLWGN